MKILFVVNNFYYKGNGLSASARRTVKYLKEAGEDVKVLSGRSPYSDGIEPEFKLSTIYIPIFNNLVKKQGYEFAKSDKSIIKEAIEWADVIHLEEPFFLEMTAAKMAKELNKPITATYHLHPENLFASVGLERSKFINKMMLHFWKKTVFDYAKIISCPTINSKERLKRNKFKAKLEVIPNGLVIEDPGNLNPSRVDDGYYKILSIGRLSKEKDEITLLKAMKYSKYAKKISLIFAGRGPVEQKLKKEAFKLYRKGIISVYPTFGFYQIGKLQELARTSDLYIHCASIEVEGLSCLEAISTGIVPIIAKAKYSATTQFAKSKQSIFKAHDAIDLASKIDYWLEDEQRRKNEALKYLEYKEKYDIKKSIAALIEMFKEAVNN